jgi:enoyl-CoA hydratase/carnithine racemase
MTKMTERLADSMMTFGGILELHVGHSIAVLTLNDRPRRNAMSLEMMDALWLAREEIEARTDIRVVIITGTGDSFSAGGNVRDMVDRKGIFDSEDPAWARDINLQRVHQIPNAIYGISAPTVAAVNGHAIGGGCDLALMCDIRIAAESARFSESFLRVGLLPGDGGAWFLPRVVGLARAMEMALTCEVLNAENAERIGLVSRVVPDDQLMSVAMDVAQTIAKQPPNAARMTKQLMRFGAEAGLAETLQMTAAMQGIAQTSEEHREAAQRLAKRLKD